jgi:hypothetical protein
MSDAPSAIGMRADADDEPEQLPRFEKEDAPHGQAKAA